MFVVSWVKTNWRNWAIRIWCQTLEDTIEKIKIELCLSALTKVENSKDYVIQYAWDLPKYLLQYKVIRLRCSVLFEKMITLSSDDSNILMSYDLFRDE